MKETSRKKQIITLAGTLLIPLLFGGLSVFISADGIQRFEELNHPPLAPDGTAYPFIWSGLYLMMGAALYLIYTAPAERERKWKAIVIYAAQLVLHPLWAIFFFTFSQYIISLILMIVVTTLTLITVIRFFPIRRSAGILMTIPLLWTAFAAYLTVAFIIMSVTPMPIAI